MLQSLCSWITKKTGHHITKDNFDRISLTLQELAQNSGMSEEEYACKVIGESIESQHFIDKYMTTESYFMRYKPNMEIVARQMIPGLLKKGIKPNILSIPCARGEEPYSMSMVLIDAGISLRKVNITAVDISKQCIHSAKKGEFSAYSFRRLPKYYIQKYFRKTGRNIFTINSDFRSSVNFVNMNILTDLHTFASNAYHVIFCHNLFIYFNRSAINITLEAFKNILDNDGWLFVDSSEGAHVERHFKRKIINDNVFIYCKNSISNDSFLTTPKYQSHQHIKITSPTISTPTVKKIVKKQPLVNISPQRSISKQPSNNIDKQIHKAQIAYQSKNFSTAINIFEKIIKENSSYESLVRLGLAKIHADNENDLEALENAELALELDAQSYTKNQLGPDEKQELYSLIALILRKKGMIQKANHYFSKLKKLNPSHPALVMEEK